MGQRHGGLYVNEVRHTDTHNAVSAEKHQVCCTALQRPDVHRQEVQGYQRRDRVDGTPASYSEGPGIKPRSRDQLD